MPGITPCRGKRCRSLAARSLAIVNSRVHQQLVDGTRQAVTVVRIGIQVAEDDESSPSWQATTLAVIVDQVAGLSRPEEISPEPYFIVVAAAIAILGTVEDRWCWM